MLEVFEVIAESNGAQDVVRPRRQRVKAGTARDVILGAALVLFRRGGFDAISLDKVADLAELNKMSIYRTYGSREALAMAAIKRLCELESLHWRNLESLFPDMPAQRLERIFEDLVAPSEHDWYLGWAVHLFGKSPANQGSDLCNVIATHRNGFREWLDRQATAAGVLEHDALADMLVLLWDGATLNMRMPQSSYSRVRDLHGIAKHAIESFGRTTDFKLPE